jgi:hypothetical protein
VFHDVETIGYKYGNGSWSGMIALLSSGIAQFGDYPVIVTRDTSEVVAYTVPLAFAR